MKKQLLLIATALFAAGCTQKSDYECRFTLNGETHLTFNFTNVDTPKSFAFFYNQSFPADQHQYIFSIEHDTTIEYTLPLNHPAEAICYCRSNNLSFNMFLVQNEPLIANYDMANDSIWFVGFTKPICEHLSCNPTWLYEDYDEDVSCFAKIDKAYLSKQKSLDSAFNAKQLPKWFYELQTENLLYHKIELKESYAWHFGYVDNLRKENPIRESKYYWLDNYTNYLFLYRAPKFDSVIYQPTSKDVYFNCTQNNLDIIKSHLPEDIVSYYTAARLSVFVNFLRRAQSVSEYEKEKLNFDKMIATNSSRIKDTALLNYIVNEPNKIYSNLITRNTLKPGDKAPNFYLKNVDDKSVSLSDFAGKLVLLNFWDTHCSACISSIPKKNALVEKFGKQGFELVNICLDNAPDVWRQIISEHHPLGEQLICKGQWEKNLRDNYMISSRPHFVLVDRNGLIIDSHVKGDSLEVFIERNIRNK